MVFMSCVCHAFASVHAALWSLLGKVALVCDV